MEKQIKEALSVYDLAHKKATETLKEFPEVVERLNADFNRLLNPLKTKIGMPGIQTDLSNSSEFETITKLDGKDFNAASQNKTAPEKVDKQRLKADENEAVEIKKQVDELEPLFLEIESDKLVDEHSDIVLRGIAKRAGLPVTEENPKTITVKYINQIKEAIKKNKELLK